MFISVGEWGSERPVPFSGVVILWRASASAHGLCSLQAHAGGCGLGLCMVRSSVLLSVWSTGWGGGIGLDMRAKKKFVYLKSASHCWFSIQNCIFPPRQVFLVLGEGVCVRVPTFHATCQAPPSLHRTLPSWRHRSDGPCWWTLSCRGSIGSSARSKNFAEMGPGACGLSASVLSQHFSTGGGGDCSVPGLATPLGYDAPLGPPIAHCPLPIWGTSAQS